MSIILDEFGRSTNGAHTDFAVPPPISFASIFGGAQATYFHGNYDEAMRHGREDALLMRHDCFLRGLLQERILGTAGLRWHLEVDNEADPWQFAVKNHLSREIKRIPHFVERVTKPLLQSIWYGRAGCQVVWDWQWGTDEKLGMVRSLVLKDIAPVNGDKIGHRYSGVPYLHVNVAEGSELRDAQTIITTLAKGLLLKGTWRDRFILHQHELEDPDYFDSERGDAIYGVGIRSVLFWHDWLKREYLAWLTDFLERFGLGLTLIKFEAGNNASKQAAQQTADDLAGRKTVVLVPFLPGEKGANDPVVRVETPSSAAEVILKLLRMFDHYIRYFVTGEGGDMEEGGRRGGDEAKLLSSTKYRIFRLDAQNLADTMTNELVGKMKLWTFPWADFPVRFVYDVDAPDVGDRIKGINTLWEMNVGFDADELRGLTGMSKPVEGAAVVSKGKMLELEASLKPLPDPNRDPGGHFSAKGQTAEEAAQAEGEGPPPEEGAPSAEPLAASADPNLPAFGQFAMPDEGEDPDDAWERAGARRYVNRVTGEEVVGDMPDLSPEDEAILDDLERRRGGAGQNPVPFRLGEPLRFAPTPETFTEALHPREQSGGPHGGEFTAKGGGGGSGGAAKPEGAKPASGWQKVQTRTGKTGWVHGTTRQRAYGEKEPKPIPEGHYNRPAVTHVPSYGAEKVNRVLENAFGGAVKPEELGRVIGAPQGATVQVHPTTLGLVIAAAGYQFNHLQRSLIPHPDGTVEMHNDVFFLKKAFQRGGLGLQIFSDEVRECSRLGVNKITTLAGKGGGMNGYYTWPRLGYNAKLTSYDKARLPSSLKGSEDVLDLFKTEEGRAWWKKHGDMRNMEFDLSEGSKSLASLNEYLVAKGKPPIEGVKGEVKAQRQAKQDEVTRLRESSRYVDSVRGYGIGRDVEDELHAQAKVYADRIRANAPSMDTADRWDTAYYNAMQDVFANHGQEIAAARARQPMKVKDAPWDQGQPGERQELVGPKGDRSYSGRHPAKDPDALTIPAQTAMPGEADQFVRVYKGKTPENPPFEEAHARSPMGEHDAQGHSTNPAGGNWQEVGPAPAGQKPKVPKEKGGDRRPEGGKPAKPEAKAPAAKPIVAPPAAKSTPQQPPAAQETPAAAQPQPPQAAPAQPVASKAAFPADDQVRQGRPPAGDLEKRLAEESMFNVEPQYLTDAQKPVYNAAVGYTGGYYKRLNKAMRDRTPLDEKQRAIYDGLKTAFAETADLSEPTLVRRGMSLPAAEAEKFYQFAQDRLAGGESFQLGGFVSTSFDPDTAFGVFAVARSGDEEQPVGMEIVAKKGVYMDRSGMDRERELLLDESSRFRVVAVKDVPYVNEVGTKRTIKVVQLEQL